LAKVRYDQVHILVKFRSGKPVAEQDLLAIFLSLGYNKIPDEQRVVVGPIKRTSFATKGRSQAFYTEERGIIGIRGESFDEVMRDFRGFLTALRSSEEIDAYEESEFCEAYLAGSLHGLGKKAPLKDFERSLGSLSILERISEVIGEPVLPLSLRVFPRKHVNVVADLKDIPDWLDLTLQPVILNPRQYGFTLVYRKPSIRDTLDFITGWPRMLIRIVDMLGATD